MTADSRKKETEYLNLKNNRIRCKEINYKTKSIKHVVISQGTTGREDYTNTTEQES